MTAPPPSIFNDVIGPVMRGPSSSHCAAAVRIGRLARDLMAGRVERLRMEFDARGSLAATHASQGSDMGLFGGLMGWDADGERLSDSAAALAATGARVEIQIGDFGDPHPNTYRLTLENAKETRRMIALSTGGGMIEVTEIDGVPVSIKGDYHETLVWMNGAAEAACRELAGRFTAEEILTHRIPGARLMEIRSREALPEDLAAALGSRSGVVWVRRLAPVLPVLSRRTIHVPYLTCAQMLAANAGEDLDLGRLAARYESARGGIPEPEVRRRMVAILRILRAAVARGIQGTRFEDRILGWQSGGFKAAAEGGRLLDAGMLNAMILNVTALIEVKSAMGVIVAAPTAGSCGALPGAVIAAAESLGLPEERAAGALLAAGLIGVFICARSTFAAEVCGCQAECGAASGMAAAALATLAGGNAKQATDAASMALQNVLGMVCDPVGNRVEVPCLGKNVMAAANALTCANMALAGFDAVIPLDEVIETMDRVGKSLPVELRCTALGGLSVTPASREIEQRLRT
jgi:L-serine dehydratase